MPFIGYKLHPQENLLVLVSLHEKAGANLRIYKKTRIYIKELNDRSNYMPNYWSNMKLHRDFAWNIQIVLQVVACTW